MRNESRRHLHKDRLPPHPPGATYEELHLRNLLVNLLHKLNDEIDQLVLQHLLGVEVGDQEGNVVSLEDVSSTALKASQGQPPHLDGLPPQNEERLGSLS